LDQLYGLRCNLGRSPFVSAASKLKGPAYTLNSLFKNRQLTQSTKPQQQDTVVFRLWIGKKK
jgi:hypothetical protein